jgi:hypothetical protein
MPTEDNSWIGGLVKTTSSGNKFLDVSELTGKDKGVAMRWAVDNKVTAVGTKELASLQDINTARGNIDDMLGQIQSILPKDAQSRIAQYGNIKLSSLMQTNEARAAFGSWRTAAIRNLRATAGTTGLRINQKEIELAVKNDIPQITDTWPVAQRKMENIKSMLGRAERPIVTNDWRDGATTTPTTGAPDVVWKLVNGKLVKE